MLVTSDGYGAFHATNGFDTVYAKYERGRKGPDGYHPHWNLTINGEVHTLYTNKNSVLELVETMLTSPLPRPLTSAETSQMSKRDGEVHGVVRVSLSEMIDRDLEEFLDMLNDRLSEEPLSNVEYHAVGISLDGNYLFLRVSGSADFLEEESGSELDN